MRPTKLRPSTISFFEYIKIMMVNCGCHVDGFAFWKLVNILNISSVRETVMMQSMAPCGKIVAPPPEMELTMEGFGKPARTPPPPSLPIQELWVKACQESLPHPHSELEPLMNCFVQGTGVIETNCCILSGYRLVASTEIVEIIECGFCDVNFKR